MFVFRVLFQYEKGGGRGGPSHTTDEWMKKRSGRSVIRIRTEIAFAKGLHTPAVPVSGTF